MSLLKVVELVDLASFNMSVKIKVIVAGYAAQLNTAKWIALFVAVPSKPALPSRPVKPMLVPGEEKGKVAERKVMR